jgi:protein SCO1/2
MAGLRRNARRRLLPAVALGVAMALADIGTATAATPASAPLDFHRFGMPLTDLAGRVARFADWRGKAVVVAMDHTQSLVVCSDTIRRLRAVQTAAERLGRRFDYLVISLDPTADTPAQWARYKAYFDVDRPGWHFLEASDADTQALVELLGIRVSYDQGYRFHEVKLFRVDGDGRVVRTLEGYDRDTEAFIR